MYLLLQLIHFTPSVTNKSICLPIHLRAGRFHSFTLWCSQKIDTFMSAGAGENVFPLRLLSRQTSACGFRTDVNSCDVDGSQKEWLMSQPSSLIAAQWNGDGWQFHKEFNEAEKFMQITPTPESLRVSESANAFACFRTIERKEVINLNDVEVCDLPSGKIEIPKREDEKFPMPLTHARRRFPPNFSRTLCQHFVGNNCASWLFNSLSYHK